MIKVSIAFQKNHMYIIYHNIHNFCVHIVYKFSGQHGESGMFMLQCHLMSLYPFSHQLTWP